ncbi:hypothetical protein FPV67DRAFT_1622208 [Lyophyllum atratum]|nr:hypothetical protein FPV67DRAFT_1622208 [Lyophyllum atratum]
MSNRETELGTLIVVVLKARNLNDKHSFYKQDVFAQVSLNGKCFLRKFWNSQFTSCVTKRTHVDVKGGQHPEWDAEIRFSVMKQSQDKSRKLEVACFAKEPRSDDILGKGAVDITDTLKTGEFDDWVGLDVDGVVRGDLYLEMTFFSNTPAPTTSLAPQSLAPPSSNLNRRPSKLAPSERLSRHPHPSAPSAVLHNLLSDNPRKDQAPWSNTPSSHGHHLAPSPASSRSSSASSIKRADSPLPPLPEGVSPPAAAPLPSTLLPGGGRPRPQKNLTPHVTPDLPATLRPGPGKQVAPLSITSANARPSTSVSPSPRLEYFAAPSSPAYRPVVAQPGTSYGGVVSNPNPAPNPGYYAPPPSQATSQLWAPEGATAGPLSFPVPTVAPAQSGPSYRSVYTAPEPPLSYQPPVKTSELPDPYLQARYQTPLPLPTGSTSPPRGRQPLPPRENPEQARLEALRQIEDEAARRKEQEEKDLALAMQLDRELNVEDSEPTPTPSNRNTSHMPGGW